MPGDNWGENCPRKIAGFTRFYKLESQQPLLHLLLPIALSHSTAACQSRPQEA